MKEFKEKDIVDFILNLEFKYNLIDLRINDIYFWKLIRFDIFSRIAKETGFYDKTHSKEPKIKISKDYIVRKLNEEFYRLKYNALKGKYLKDILVFQCPRKTKVNGKDIDIYTHFIVNKIERINKYDYALLESQFINKRYHNENKINLARSSNLRLLFNSFFIKIQLNSKELSLFQKIRSEIFQTFNVDIDITVIVKKAIQNYKTNFSYYYKLINKRKPKKVYLVCSYGLEALISAARENGTEVIEIQHGVMSKYHVGYSFPYNKNIPYFPDKMLLFGKYWYDITPLPLSPNNVTYYGYPYLEKQIIKYKSCIKQKNYIIFLSQNTITDRLSQIAYEFAKKNNTYNIIYKLHPNEFNVWKNKYQVLLKANELLNFHVIDNNNKNLYELFAESEYQVGVNSTAIYEGLAMGLKTILINLSGIEHMEYLLEKKLIPKANNADELSLCIKEYDTFNCEKDYYFKNIDDFE